MNRLWVPDTFKTLFKEKRRASESLFKGVKDGIRRLRSSEVPEGLGPRKQGGLSETHALVIDNANRILYGVRRMEGYTVVALFRVCDHRQYYQPESLTSAEYVFFTQSPDLILTRVEASESWVQGSESTGTIRRRRRFDPDLMYR